MIQPKGTIDNAPILEYKAKVDSLFEQIGSSLFTPAQRFAELQRMGHSLKAIKEALLNAQAQAEASIANQLVMLIDYIQDNYTELSNSFSDPSSPNYISSSASSAIESDIYGLEDNQQITNEEFIVVGASTSQPIEGFLVEETSAGTIETPSNVLEVQAVPSMVTQDEKDRWASLNSNSMPAVEPPIPQENHPQIEDPFNETPVVYMAILGGAVVATKDSLTELFEELVRTDEPLVHTEIFEARKSKFPLKVAFK